MSKSTEKLVHKYTYSDYLSWSVEKSKYARPEVYQIDEVIKIGIFEDLTISLVDVFGG